jgi:cell division protein FtsN
LSKLKKAEMLYAQGAYITSSKILKEFNLFGPAHLQTASAKNLFLRSLNAAGQNDSLKVYQDILASKKSSTKKRKSFQKNNSVWFIQFGAFSSKENAQILKDSLIENRIKNIQIDQVFNSGSMIYYVRSSHFKTYDMALKASKKLKGKIQFTISGF